MNIHLFCTFLTHCVRICVVSTKTKTCRAGPSGVCPCNNFPLDALMPLLYSLVNLVKGYFYCGVVYLIIIVNKFKVILDDWNFKGHTIYWYLPGGYIWYGRNRKNYFKFWSNFTYISQQFRYFYLNFSFSRSSSFKIFKKAAISK